MDDRTQGKTLSHLCSLLFEEIRAFHKNLRFRFNPFVVVPMEIIISETLIHEGPDVCTNPYGRNHSEEILEKKGIRTNIFFYSGDPLN